MKFTRRGLIVLAALFGSLAISSPTAAQDCNGNGYSDDGEIEIGESQDCNWNGIPDECEVRDPARDCDADGVPDDCQPDCDLDGVADACEIAAGASDCNGDGVPDSCDLAPSFRLDWPPGLVATGRNLTTLAAADFDGDGNLDLAVGTDESPLYTIFHGRGDRSFAPGLNIPARRVLPPLIAADLNGDGAPDLAAIDPQGFVAILWNLPGFPLTSVPLPSGTGVGIAAADIDRDGDLDLALGRTLTILENDGKGSFVAGPPLPMGGRLHSIVAGDLDGDGNVDFAGSNLDGREVSVFRNLGGGEFEERRFLTGAEPTSVAVVDADEDERPDLVVACRSSGIDGTLNVLRNGGDLSFTEGPIYPVGDGLQCLTVADFNSDGMPDLAATRSTGRGDERETVFFAGLGDGTFAPAGSTGPTGYTVLGADFDRDGRPDLAMLWSAYTAMVSWNEGGGRFANLSSIQTAAGVVNLASGDLDGDGTEDLAAGQDGGGARVLPLLNRGGGEFAAGRAVALDRSLLSLAVADLDRDGDLDIAACQSKREDSKFVGYISILKNSGAGEFTLAEDFRREPRPGAMAAADLDGDGSVDLAIADNETGADTLSILWGAGDGTFPTALAVPVGRALAGVKIADLDGDGRLDVVSWSPFKEKTWTIRNLGGRAFAEPIAVSWGNGAAIGDFNGDGAPDIAVTSGVLGLVAILTNDGHGGFPVVEYLAQDTSPRDIWATDLNQDGTADLIVEFFEAWCLGVFLRGPRGPIGPPITIPIVPFASPVVAADFDGDGRPDLATLASRTGAISLMLSPARPPRSTDENHDGIPDDCGPIFRRCDANADGRIDISDGIRIFDVLFRGAPLWPCPRAADCDGDGQVNLSDGLYSIAYQLLGGSVPPQPFPACGGDPLSSELPCTAHPTCGR